MVFRIIGIVVGVIFVLAILELFILGIYGGIGPLKGLRNLKMAKLPGNDTKYYLENIKPIDDSPLKDKHLLFLGSSVTNGAASLGVSMADYIRVIDQAIVIKEAVNGTTLCDDSPLAYFSRLKKIDTKEKIDIAIVQLSTNDAKQKKKLGEISKSKDINFFDSQTIIGAIESIISYCQTTFNCKIMFYTGTKFNSPLYQEMVDALLKIKEKWNIDVLDLWNDESMNFIPKEDYKLYMNDPIHPTQAGYLKWWTPKFEEMLYSMTKRS